MGDLTFFILIWPHDKTQPLFSAGGADMWFWLHCAQTVLFAALAALVMRRLAQLVPNTQPNRNLAAKSTKIAKGERWVAFVGSSGKLMVPSS